MGAEDRDVLRDMILWFYQFGQGTQIGGLRKCVHTSYACYS